MVNEMLFDEVTTKDHDWFDVCSNSDKFFVEDEDDKQIFDAMKIYLQEYNRLRVSKVLSNGKFYDSFLISVLNETLPNNEGIMFCARELMRKIPYKLFSSIIAFSHNGVGTQRVVFPDKEIRKATSRIPQSLLNAFGLRFSERQWFHRLAANESFVRMVAGNIKTEDWKYIIHNKTTLLKKEENRTTAPQFTTKEGVMLW